jgi:AbrB family looped-hinge helix DNA binding protein
MVKRFETTMSQKGQVVISKDIRKELRLRSGQKFVEEMRGKEIVLKPVSGISSAGGILKGLDTRPTSLVIKEVKKGWK